MRPPSGAATIVHDAHPIKSAGLFRALLRFWPDRSVLARDLDISYFTVAAWYRRNSVPEWHWDGLLRSAATHRIPDVSLEILRAIATDPWGKRIPQPIAKPNARRPPSKFVPKPDALCTAQAIVQDAQRAALPIVKKLKPTTRGRKSHGA